MNNENPMRQLGTITDLDGIRTRRQSNPSPASTAHANRETPQCETCGGAGYLRYDVPVGHALFGQIVPCQCRQDELRARERARLVALSGLQPAMRRMTFDAYSPRDAGTQQALADAVTFAAEPSGWLYLHGGYGCGKTHLLTAIAWSLVDRGVSAFYVVVPDLLVKLQATFNDGSDETFAERFKRIKDADVLLLDDLGAEKSTEWAQAQMFDLINSRYLAEKPLVVASNLTPAQIGGRVGSRLGDRHLTSFVSIGASDYRKAEA
jgi:DNA replication protein DnaC